MNQDRGMMKYIPYKSLVEQGDYLAKMAYEKGKREKRPMFEEKAEKINAILSSYHGQDIKLTYYHDGYEYVEEGKLTCISAFLKTLEINELEIPFKAIVDIEEKGEDFYW
ncbi:MAG: YolD-like family protein [Bacilli bacterium]|nr:YolD-like family protein [Bacilli bacterium]